MKKTLFTDSTSIFSVVEVLGEALMTAEKSRVVYRLDRQKLSGSASLSSEGGTAVDVLRSIPSVRVDSEGEVSFRGSTGYLVYIDGHQSVLEGTQALQQILRNRLSASIVAHDIFRTARYDNHLISPTLISTTHVRPKYPNIVLSLTYSFNAEGQHKDKDGAVSSGAFFEGKDF